MPGATSDSPTSSTQSANRFAFTGHIWDTETGLYNAKARYFDPKLGRFLTQDSFLGTQDNPPSLHRYLYGYANPVRYVDPTGNAPEEPRYEGFEPVVVDGQIYGIPRYSESIEVRATLDPAYALPQQLGAQVAPLNRAAEVGVRTAGVAAQGTAAVAFGWTPAGAYFAIRAADEGQALARELWTGEATQSEAQQGLQIAIQSTTGTDQQTAGLFAAGTLMVADAGVGFGGVRGLPKSQPTTKPLEGIVKESKAPATNGKPALDPVPTTTNPESGTAKVRSVRKRDYPYRERKATQQRLEDAAKDAEGNIRCQSPDCSVPGGRVLEPGEGTPQHTPPLVETHNEVGWNTDQPTRNNLFNETAEELHCIQCQKKEGGRTTQTYRRDTGPKYQPKPTRKKPTGTTE